MTIFRAEGRSYSRAFQQLSKLMRIEEVRDIVSDLIQKDTQGKVTITVITKG